ncbi:hypothetical protein QYF61_000542 [Mycteria americana]|uniref:Uncharacterized protein n=1 Tax=Mycteria americana TaxID=33587 RepID=A0AAN7NNG5_MYCAM|nr:hypothetical protein QYF61_000542 [Mycteria americana]
MRLSFCRFSIAQFSDCSKRGFCQHVLELSMAAVMASYHKANIATSAWAAALSSCVDLICEYELVMRDMGTLRRA